MDQFSQGVTYGGSFEMENGMSDMTYSFGDTVEFTEVPFAPISGFILPSAAGPLLDDDAKTPDELRLATAITFFACL